MYLSKKCILKALEVLSRATPTILNNFSAIQYFLATDNYYKEYLSPCDSKDKKSKADFFKNVRNIVSLDDGNYFSSFKQLYEGGKSINSTVSSNFFNGSSVELSNNTSGKKFDYPKNYPLLYALDGKVYTEGSYYLNLSEYYLVKKEERVALVLWLLRKSDNFKELTVDEFRISLGELFSPIMVDTLIPADIEEWGKIVEELDIQCSEEAAIIIKSDIYEKDFTKEVGEKYQSQLIYYGAPGTGKSNAIKREVDEKGLPNIRTTFHPDSDYSTFVGSYKPKVVDMPVLSIIGEKAVETGRTEKKIVYEFVPQAFLKAYTGAWKNPNTPFFLIIEEINRGNCAQIFGDIFQLLDRKDGVSEYPITPDEDIQKFLLTDEKYGFAGLSEEQKAGIPTEILSGEIMRLPKNLHIWATMNTSDQSLFPIDSAFKRRWDWKYIKIAEGRDSETRELLNWTVKFNYNEDDKPYSFECSWWEFIKAINEKIASATSSDDKKLGYFFCKPEEKSSTIIDKERFVGKVVFYLWNDVFKDEENAIFKVNDSKKEPSFDAFYKEDEKGDTVVDTSALRIFLHNVFGENKELYKETALSE